MKRKLLAMLSDESSSRAGSGRPLAVFTDLDELDPAPGVALLTEAGFDCRTADGPDPDSIVRAARTATALLVGYAPVDAALLDRLPALRVIATLGAGYEHVDTAAAHARGITVCNLPDAATEEVAVHALATALALVRRLPQADAAVRRGGWNRDLAELPRRASELTLGVLGLGRIGTRLAALAAPVFGRVVGHDPRPTATPRPVPAHRVGLDELLATSDVLSLHLPLTDATRGLLDATRLARLPHGAVLVNTARAGLLDHTALLAALDTGALSGAALDVLPEEPPAPDDPLRSHPRLLLSPHSAFLSDATLRAYVVGPARNVIAWHRTGTPLTPVPSAGVPA
ncbi:C-terminal binding protein [Kitasatospora phosalacinea]|uniref:C-terminal binding protein n=1 Tax=Kitasatospora phosalacinea TaxID=2065 RepID=UPI0035DDAB71